MRHRADFLRLQQHGHKWVTPAFVIYIAPFESDAGRCQLGFTVTKKLGNAVIRNRIKRRLRAVVDELKFPLWQMTLIARHECLNYDFKNLAKDLQWAIKRIEKRLEEKQETSC